LTVVVLVVVVKEDDLGFLMSCVVDLLRCLLVFSLGLPSFFFCPPFAVVVVRRCVVLIGVDVEGAGKREVMMMICRRGVSVMRSHLNEPAFIVTLTAQHSRAKQQPVLNFWRYAYVFISEFCH
jgi:hypothetical protein